MVGRVAMVGGVAALVAVLGAVYAMLFGFGSGEFEQPVDVLAKMVPTHPAVWKENDVAAWLNTTVKYPEYSGAFKAHAVDGATLFYLVDSDLQYLGVKNQVHRAKLRAHLDLLRKKCVCTENANADDLWAFLAAYPYRTLIMGVTFLYSPRLGLLWLYLSSPDIITHLSSVLYVTEYPYVAGPIVALCAVAAPYVLALIVGTNVFLPSNYIVFIAVARVCFYNQMREVSIMRNFLTSIFEPRHTFQEWVNYLLYVDDSRAWWLKETIISVVTAVVGIVLPEFAVRYIYYAVILMNVGSSAFSLFMEVVKPFISQPQEQPRPSS